MPAPRQLGDVENEKVPPKIDCENDEPNVDLQPPPVPSPEEKKTPRKRKTELEKLEIDMKGWNCLFKSQKFDNILDSAAPFIHNTFKLEPKETEDVLGQKWGLKEGADSEENVDCDFNTSKTFSDDENFELYLI